MKNKLNIGGYERMKIGSNIRKWRSVKDIKQKDLAASLKMSEAALSNIENDCTDISLSHLEDIAIVLDMEIEQLFSDPQENLKNKYHNYTITESSQDKVMDKELVYALIGSIQKKDEQLKNVLDSVIYKIDKIGNSNNILI